MANNVRQPETPSRAQPAPDAAVTDRGGERARIAADSAPVMLWMTNAERQFDWFNAAWQTYTGRTEAQLLGERWLTLIHAEDVDRVRGIFSVSVDAGLPFTLDYRLRRHDGSYRWVLDNGVPRREPSGEFAGYVGSVVDIHERKQRGEQLAEHTQTLRLARSRQVAFLATLSHELRNPLAPIANAASVLRTLENSNPVLVRLREIIERQGNRLGRLVEDLIDATRAAQGHISLAREHLAVESLVHSAVAASAEQLKQVGHTLEVDLPERPLFVNGDPVRLMQALSNIVSNAAKFTRETGVIWLEVGSSGGDAEIMVRDPGEGIAADFLPHVFELFAQQHRSPGRKPPGLGVGLTLARRIARLHGGDVKAFSDGPGQGARFVLSLPLADCDSALSASRRERLAC